MSLEQTYSPIYAVDGNNFGRCFYCGCEAVGRDYVPPLRHVLLYERHYGTDHRMIVPVCSECSEFLIGVREATIEERMRIVKKKISNRYKKPLRIYSSWGEDELDSLSSGLRKSVGAGMSLGAEAYSRLQFQGYSYEYEGVREYVIARERVTYTVFGEVFDNLRDALLFTSRAYRINIHKLEEYFIDAGGSLELAVNKYMDDLKAAILDKEIKELCRVFCLKYKQSERFVEKTVRIYLEQFPEETVEWCLDKIYRERVSK